MLEDGLTPCRAWTDARGGARWNVRLLSGLLLGTYRGARARPGAPESYFRGLYPWLSPSDVYALLQILSSCGLLRCNESAGGKLSAGGLSVSLSMAVELVLGGHGLWRSSSYCSVQTDDSVRSCRRNWTPVASRIPLAHAAIVLLSLLPVVHARLFAPGSVGMDSSMDAATTEKFWLVATEVYAGMAGVPRSEATAAVRADADAGSGSGAGAGTGLVPGSLTSLNAASLSLEEE